MLRYLTSAAALVFVTVWASHAAEPCRHCQQKQACQDGARGACPNCQEQDCPNCRLRARSGQAACPDCQGGRMCRNCLARRNGGLGGRRTAGECCAVINPSGQAQTRADRLAAYNAYFTPWHGAYYNANWNRPLALVVPPTASMRTAFGWGVPSTRMVPNYHQFGRYWQGPGVATPAQGNGLLPTPVWPSDTSQFGTYYVRAPY